MLFWGLSLTEWTAIAAIGALALAAATVAAIIVATRTARTDRRRDDARRAEDRQWDSDRRKEDRDRDDRLRREAADEWDRRARAERRDREDYEARQVTVEVAKAKRPEATMGREPNHRITISTPATYSVKGVDVQIAHLTNGGIGILQGGFGGDEPSADNGRVYYRFWAEIPDQLFQPAPIVRFVDRYGNLYYQYRNHTRRFPQNTQFHEAAQEIDQCIRLGPKPD